MSARQLARVSNDFKPSSRTIPVGDLLSSGEVAAILGLSREGLAARVRRLEVPVIAMSRSHPGQITIAKGHGHVRYFTHRQVEQLRGKS
jgi:hypothetical protein